MVVVELPVPEGEDTSAAAGVILPKAVLIFSAFLVPWGSDTRTICEFQRRFYSYIIVDTQSLFMCSGYFGWLFSKRKNLCGEQFREPAAAPSYPASSQAERNILLWKHDVNMLWSSFFSTPYSVLIEASP